MMKIVIMVLTCLLAASMFVPAGYATYCFYRDVLLPQMGIVGSTMTLIFSSGVSVALIIIAIPIALGDPNYG